MATGELKSVTPSDGDHAQKFDTGACRSDSSKKLNFIKALSPLVLTEYVDYIRSFNVKNIDGKVREEDNWKLGIPRQQYIESKARHFIDTWKIHEGYIPDENDEKIIRCLCAEMFNTHGYLHTLLIKRLGKEKAKPKVGRTEKKRAVLTKNQLNGIANGKYSMRQIGEMFSSISTEPKKQSRFGRFMYWLGDIWICVSTKVKS